MSDTVIVNTKNVASIAQTFFKCLKELQNLGVQWNLAEVAVAFNELIFEIRTDLDKQKRKGMAM